jgi:hypothetical protein
MTSLKLLFSRSVGTPFPAVDGRGAGDLCSTNFLLERDA